ncbi:MAG: hypothetical protein KGI53_05960 [Nitrospirota bacterium]|nr:hypothetical protein [Nitrospirota bacterium]
MPVNMDPKKRKKAAAEQSRAEAQRADASGSGAKKENMEEVTERDKELDAAEAEWKNLWDATEVIDMDRW